ncbi:PLDc N-terminal domain-containing protein [Cellulophaga sp. HaHa_2_1]|nr:PLDc N-terminal domain-containing protein [Cellulophaga sp. HaHa_2_1]
MLYFLGIALQIFCVYHCYTNRNSYYWIMAIIFLPIFGALSYLILNVFTKRDLDVVQEGLTSVINPTKRIADLEKKFKFSNTFKNQVALADAYLDHEMYEKAVENYEGSLKDVFVNDYYVILKLIKTNYLLGDYEQAISYAQRIKEDSKFRKSEGLYYYSLSIEKLGNINEAERLFSQFDAPYSNYFERLELSRFYMRNMKKSKAKILLNEILSESEHMSRPNYKQHKSMFKAAKELLNNIT